MSTQSVEYLEAIEHLPAGAILVFPQVTWEQYESLLEDLVGRPGLRVSYNEGRLEIMSPLSEHEDYKEFILQLARVLSEEFDIPLEPRGSTTWKLRKLRKGAEPDTCFYVTNAHRIIGKRIIDLESVPPPDIVVEIDTPRASESKFPIYAALGVPEIWRYRRGKLSIFTLKNGAYKEQEASAAFPLLSAADLTRLLESSTRLKRTAWLRQLRTHFRKLKSGQSRLSPKVE